MRQAEDSEIIRLSMKIRNMEPLSLYQGTNVQVLNKSNFVSGMYTWADQVIVSTNRERIRINNEIRNILGRGPEPEDGDKVICLKNYWEDYSSNGDSLVNGTIGVLKNPVHETINMPWIIKTDIKQFNILNTIIETDDGEYIVNVDEKMIKTGERSLDWKTSYQIGKNIRRVGDLIPKEFVYAYAITGHKSQGSEYGKVLVIEESFPFNKEEHARWLYTTCTRASEKLVLLRK